MSEQRTCLVYHVYEGLGIVPTETTDQVAFTRTGEDHLNQRTKFVRGKFVLDQTLTGWNVEVEKEQ